MSIKIKSLLDRLWVRVILVMFAIMLPVNIFGIMSVTRAQSALIDSNHDNLQRIGQLAMKDLDDRMTGCDYYLLQELEKDVDYQLLQSKGDSTANNAIAIARQAFFMTLQERISSYAHADAYFFYFPEDKQGEVTIGADVEGLKSLLRDKILAFVGNDVRNTNTPWMVAEIGQDKWLIREVCNNKIICGAMIYLGQVEEDLIRETGLSTTQAEICSEATILDDTGKITETTKSQNAKVKLVLSVETKEIVRNLPLLQRLGLAIGILMLLAIPLLFIILNKLVLKPLDVLENSMTLVEAGNNDYQITKKAESHEFRHLYKAFNSMVNTQKELKIQIYEKEIQRQKMEIQNLQLQIRPHFLLNGFNLLYGLVSIGEIQSAQSMILYLSDYFRYIFRSGKELEDFSKEYQLIQKYLEIAKLRYPNTFEVEYHVSDGAMGLQVPPLLIHNLVENIICHGLIPREKIKIILTAQIEGTMAEISVQDTGIGISAEQVENFNRGIFETADGRVHVGVKNTVQRIREFYGSQGNIVFYGEEMKGTKVVIRFPKEMGENR